MSIRDPANDSLHVSDNFLMCGPRKKMGENGHNSVHYAWFDLSAVQGSRVLALFG